LSNQTYDLLKRVVQVVLPAAATLYAGLAVFWGWPHAAEVTGSITLVATFGGAVLGISTKSYNNSEAKYDGTAYVTTAETGAKKADLVLKNYENPASVADQDEIRFKVKQV